MPSVSIKITKKGFNEVNVFLDGNMKRMQDLTAPLKKGGNLMLRSTHENFKSQGRPTRWSPLSPKYLKRKLSEGFGFFTLIRKGGLRGSIVFAADKKKLKVGTSNPYAAAHQFGSPQRNLPKRPFLVFQDKDIERINILIARHMIGRDDG